jgi:ankyrin repeat protein
VSTPSPNPLPLPETINLDQQRTLAKELLRDARAGDEAALARLRAVRADAATATRPLKLADAQLALARELGFPSWPKLVDELQTRDVTRFRDAVRRGDVDATRRLLGERHVRARVNDVLFDFGGRATHAAAKNGPLLEVLIDAGADVNLRSDWENGPYTVLDHADEATARLLLARGATLTANAAARLGWIEALTALLDADPTLVHARGGDGQQPLHEAKTVAIADLLLDRGAAIDTRCIDHKSTPAQYALGDRPDVCRRLLERGATPDIFMAARLGDVALATRLVDADPACLAARVNEPGYPLVPPFNIYCWTLGWSLSPHDVARKFGQAAVRELFEARSPSRVRLIDALIAGDAARVHDLVAREPTLIASLTRQEHGRLAQAIFHKRFDAAHLMLDIGFDPAAGGVDGGTALHAACWVGHVGLVERIIALGRVGLDARDPTHGSTPLGWCAYGSQVERSPGGEYHAVAERLVAAGADITAPGNRANLTLLQMAHGNTAIQETLRRLGAR